MTMTMTMLQVAGDNMLHLFLWRGDLAIICGVLRRFAAFSGVFLRIGYKFLLPDQIFGGAQTPTPFSGRLKIIAKMGGQMPPPPP